MSMTLPPASANRSSILALTSGDAPQPQSSPKVMVPSATSEIRTPVLPKSLYRMGFAHFFGWGNDQRPTWATGLSARSKVPIWRHLHFIGELSGLPRQAAEAHTARRRQIDRRQHPSSIAKPIARVG